METLLFNILEMLVEIWATFGAGACLAVILILSALCFIIARRYRRPGGRVGNHLRHVLRERIEMDHRITGALDNLIRVFGCDRAYVTQYHNGGENICGIPFAKCSRTHERVRPGTPSQIAALQNLPNSMFAGANLVIMRDKEIACPNVENLKESDALGTYHSLREQGIRSFYQIGMFSFDGLPVGYLGIDYCRDDHPLDEEKMASLRAYALKLCGMILSEKDSDKEVGHECLAGCA